MDKVSRAIIDAVSAGFYIEEWIYAEKAEFELKFNKPWHGEDSQSLRPIVDSLVANGYLIRRQIGKDSNVVKVIALSEFGGQVWEAGFNVKWSRYCEVIDLVHDGLCVESYVAFLSRRVARTFYEKCAERALLGEVTKRKHWEWSNWKVHQIFYSIDIERCNDREGIASLVESLRKGWRSYGEQDTTRSGQV